MLNVIHETNKHNFQQSNVSTNDGITSTEYLIVNGELSVSVQWYDM